MLDAVLPAILPMTSFLLKHFSVSPHIGGLFHLSLTSTPQVPLFLSFPLKNRSFLCSLLLYLCLKLSGHHITWTVPPSSSVPSLLFYMLLESRYFIYLFVCFSCVLRMLLLWSREIISVLVISPALSTTQPLSLLRCLWDFLLMMSRDLSWRSLIQFSTSSILLLSLSNITHIIE